MRSNGELVRQEENDLFAELLLNKNEEDHKETRDSETTQEKELNNPRATNTLSDN